MPSCRWFFDLAGKLVEDEAFEVHLVGGVVDVDADEAAVLVVVLYDAFGNLAAVRARTVSEFNVQRISLGVVVQFHGLKPHVPCELGYAA
jgi:hypothetical protein